MLRTHAFLGAVITAGLCLAVGAAALAFPASPVAGRPAGPSPSASAAVSAPAKTNPPATAPQRTGAPPKRDRNPLGTAAVTYLAGRSGVVLAAVYDLATRQAFTLGDSRKAQDAASVVKVDILETLLSRHRAGLSAADQVLAERMTEDSDNDAATALWDAAGGASGIRGFNAAIGLTGTTPSSCVRCPGFPWPGWGLTTTTPLDQIALLRQLVAPSPVVSTADRDYALRLMENVAPSQRWGVSGGVPAQVTVALKNGWLPLGPDDTDWQVNSVGWVCGLGRDYLMAVLSTGNPTEADGIDTIDHLSAIVWDRMASADSTGK